MTPIAKQGHRANREKLPRNKKKVCAKCRCKTSIACKIGYTIDPPVYCEECAAGIPRKGKKARTDHARELLRRANSIRYDCIERVKAEAEMLEPYLIGQSTMKAIKVLESVVFEFSSRMTRCAGYAFWTQNRVRLSWAYFKFYHHCKEGDLEGFDGTVRHELAHMIQRRNGSKPHGFEWKRCAISLGDTGGRCHSMTTWGTENVLCDHPDCTGYRGREYAHADAPEPKLRPCRHCQNREAMIDQTIKVAAQAMKRTKTLEELMAEGVRRKNGQ